MKLFNTNYRNLNHFYHSVNNIGKQTSAIPFVNALVLFFIFNGFANTHAQTKSETISYCSDVGPVVLTFKGGDVSGTYIITVTPQPIHGTLTGTIKDGLFRGKWSDKDGVGDILLGFNPKLTRFNGIFNTAKDKTNWLNKWKGVRQDKLEDLEESKRKEFICNVN